MAFNIFKKNVSTNELAEEIYDFAVATFKYNIKEFTSFPIINDLDGNKRRLCINEFFFFCFSSVRLITQHYVKKYNPDKYSSVFRKFNDIFYDERKNCSTKKIAQLMIRGLYLRNKSYELYYQINNKDFTRIPILLEILILKSITATDKGESTSTILLTEFLDCKDISVLPATLTKDIDKMCDVQKMTPFLETIISFIVRLSEEQLSKHHMVN